jgi:F-type H+-transporting ATPase subunit b
MISVLAQEQEGGNNNFLLPNLTIVVEVLAFLLILYILKRYVWPPLSKAMTDRQEMIRQQVVDSDEASRRLREAEERYESALAEARNEAARIRDDARADAQAIREEMREQATAEVERIRVRGAEQLASQREQAVRQLRAEIGGLSMQLAERLIGQSLAGDTNRTATVDRFLAELDRMPARGAREQTPAGGAG